MSSKAPRPPARIVDRLAAILFGSICAIIATYFTILAFDLILPLLHRELLTMRATFRVLSGWVLLIVTGCGWLVAVTTSYGYVYYNRRGTVYTKALRVLGLIFAPGAVIQTVITLRPQDSPKAIWMSAGLAVVFAGVSAMTMLTARYAEIAAEKKRHQRKG